MKNSEKTIVAFHIGRGGRFNNQGFLTFIGEEKISKFTGDLFCRFENEHKFSGRYGFDNTYSDQKCILDLITDGEFDELEEKFGISKEMLGEETYYHQNSCSTGLTANEYETGIGRIEIDHDYDTTYTTYLENCNENEIQAIKDSSYWNKEYLLGLLE
jgi:hypothetical protein